MLAPASELTTVTASGCASFLREVVSRAAGIGLAGLAHSGVGALRNNGAKQPPRQHAYIRQYGLRQLQRWFCIRDDAERQAQDPG